jgi:protein-disulfide isomerase
MKRETLAYCADGLQMKGELFYEMGIARHAGMLVFPDGRAVCDKRQSGVTRVKGDIVFQTNRQEHAPDIRESGSICIARAVEVVQFGDYECKECGLVAEMLQAFRHRNDGVVSFTYKHFPRVALHRQALQAAEAAESARSQGKFWQMHNRLIVNADRLRLGDLYDYAESIGLDMARFTSEMDDEMHIPTIRSHIYNGTLAGVERTPTYFVDGMRVDGAGGVRSLLEATRLVLVARACVSGTRA